jgi:putative ABC transport system permease protein
VRSPGALLLARLLRSQLYGVSVVDPSLYALVAALLGAVALLAEWLPARRAASESPARALQGD